MCAFLWKKRLVRGQERSKMCSARYLVQSLRKRKRSRFTGRTVFIYAGIRWRNRGYSSRFSLGQTANMTVRKLLSVPERKWMWKYLRIWQQRISVIPWMCSQMRLNRRRLLCSQAVFLPEMSRMVQQSFLQRRSRMQRWKRQSWSF